MASKIIKRGRGVIDTTASPYCKLKSVNLDAVKWTHGFWAERFDLCKKVMISHMWGLLSDSEISHAWTNFRIAAGLEKGEFKGTWWHDGDFYKWLESVAYVYSVTHDEKLDQLMDEVIEVIGKAQQEDGYISTPIIIGSGIEVTGLGKGPTPFKGVKRFERIEHHELYNMGHLMTAACAHYRATGKTAFLDIAKKVGDYLYRVFRNHDSHLAHFGFNPSNIMGSVELYRTTRIYKYLDLAKIFVDMRGSVPGGSDQNQDRTPLREAKEAVGHAVTAMYLYCGAADVYMETGDKSIIEALERLWCNVVYQKMYITGGVGALHDGLSPAGDPIHEAFGRNYELPNTTAYNETCANIGNVMWNWRMLSITGEARYADVMELALYNSVLSGISIDGKSYFYTNVLRRYGNEVPLLSQDSLTRMKYIDCFCCPPNVVRTIAKINGYAYSISDKSIWVNLYGSNILNTELTDGTPLKLRQETNYPWEGKIKITIEAPSKKNFSVMLRIPGWAEGASLKVNNRPINDVVKSGQYVEITRNWSAGDLIELTLPMDVQLIEANPLVEEVRGQVAIKRGPIVYCLESPDLPEDIRVSEVIIPHNIELRPHFDKDFLGGVVILEGEALVIKEGDWSNQLYRKVMTVEPQMIKIKLIPYYAWGNRGLSHMTVWIPFVRR